MIKEQANIKIKLLVYPKVKNLEDGEIYELLSESCQFAIDKWCENSIFTLERDKLGFWKWRKQF